MAAAHLDVAAFSDDAFDAPAWVDALCAGRPTGESLERCDGGGLELGGRGGDGACVALIARCRDQS